MADHIQIGDIAPRIQYTGDGTQAQFTYPFPIFAAADMEVYLDQAKQETGFTVNGAGTSAGGDVTFDTAPASGIVVTLRRRLAIQRTSDFQESGEFRSKVINDELDYLTAALQQVSDDGDRALKLAATDPTAALELPDKATRANMFLAFDGDGDAVASDASGPPGPQGPAGDMDGSNNLSELTEAAAARSNLGLGAAAVEDVAAGGAGDLLRADGDGSALTGVETSDSVARANIVLNAFRLAVQGGLSVQNMVDGVVDEFEDETGVDTGASTNERYDDGGDFYDSVSFTTETSTQASSFSPGLDKTYIDKAWTVDNDGRVTKLGLKTNHASTGTLFVLENTSGTNYAVRASVAFNHTGGDTFEYFALATPYDVPASGNFYVAVTQATGTTTSTSATASAARSYMNSVPSGETNAFTDDTNPSLLGAAEYGDVQDMTLFANAATASAQPTDAFIVLWQQDVDAVTLNTDLKAHASRDGGTTWTQVTLAEEASLGGSGRILAGTADVSAQPAGTAMKWKLETLNAKEMKIHGVGLEWS